ncbi:MAG: hypothetical protein JWM41_631 [Gemmatimonadetes bacterium]|nr:hypothetical protein [Gemmatimonadota bacterium]
MRVGDFAVEIVAHERGQVRELESGHVLARPGQTYRLRLRNFGPLYCVVTVDIDDSCVTGGGLVLEPWGITELERPVDASEDGRFTVIAEGDESVFGPDGGRDNAALGLIEARFRRELPGHDRRSSLPPVLSVPRTPTRVIPDFSDPPSRYPSPTVVSAFDTVRPWSTQGVHDTENTIERAAGTGLTGHSDQRFVVIHLGPLEAEATVVKLRLVIGTDAALAEETTHPLVERAPARPAPRP